MQDKYLADYLYETQVGYISGIMINSLQGQTVSRANADECASNTHAYRLSVRHVIVLLTHGVTHGRKFLVF